jgi:hypothetical protein
MKTPCGAGGGRLAVRRGADLRGLSRRLRVRHTRAWHGVLSRQRPPKGGVCQGRRPLSPSLSLSGPLAHRDFLRRLSSPPQTSAAAARSRASPGGGVGGEGGVRRGGAHHHHLNEAPWTPALLPVAGQWRAQRPNNTRAGRWSAARWCRRSCSPWTNWQPKRWRRSRARSRTSAPPWPRSRPTSRASAIPGTRKVFCAALWSATTEVYLHARDRARALRWR